MQALSPGDLLGLFTQFLILSLLAVGQANPNALVLGDRRLEEVTAAVWGIDHAATVGALDAFIEKYLDQFMKAATRGWGE